jgi:hypothetical protein
METQSRGVYASYLTDKSCYNVIGAARVSKVNCVGCQCAAACPELSS